MARQVGGLFEEGKHPDKEPDGHGAVGDSITRALVVGSSVLKHRCTTNIISMF